MGGHQRCQDSAKLQEQNPPAQILSLSPSVYCTELVRPRSRPPEPLPAMSRVLGRTYSYLLPWRDREAM